MRKMVHYKTAMFISFSNVLLNQCCTYTAVPITLLSAINFFSHMYSSTNSTILVTKMFYQYKQEQRPHSGVVTV